MATRGKTTFQKRQKEMVRKERQQQKAERREQRKMMRSIEQTSPPQDPAEAFSGQNESNRTEQESADWQPALRRQDNS